MYATVCGLWIHKSCLGLSDDRYKYVREQLQNTGVGYWACRACALYAANMNRRMKQIEDRLEQYSKETETNKETLKVDSKVEKVCEELKKKDEKTEKLVKQGESNVYEEMRESETRRLNVIFFKIPELNEKNAKTSWNWIRRAAAMFFLRWNWIWEKSPSNSAEG
jgi:hypothetical protein